jgi:hypothetical protein
MSKVPPRVWVLNLDAEHELATTGSFTPTQNLRRIVAAQRAALLGTLIAPGDYLLLAAGDPHSEQAAPEKLTALQLDPSLDADGAVGRNAKDTIRATAAGHLASHLLPVPDITCLRGLVGLAWSPTPSALALLRRAGAVVAPSPAIGVLRTVNARPFAAELRDTLALDTNALPKHIVRDLDGALSILSVAAEHGWLVRRTFGAAGRGRRRIESLSNSGRSSVSSEESAWLSSGLRVGPLVIEPWALISAEYTRSAWLHADGRIAISAPCLQSTATSGAWDATQRTSGGVVAKDDDDVLGNAVETVGLALHNRGYHGPFGIDAFRHKSASGSTLNPMSEINARFTMDWTCAMGTRVVDSNS